MRPDVIADSNRDCSTPPINALPAELFLDILLQTLDFGATLIPQLHVLAQVCTYWLRSILSNSRFWCELDLQYTKLAPVVLRRNPSGPLSVRCRSVGEESSIDDFIGVIQSQARRWEALEISGDLDENRMRLFDILTPALVTLKVRVFRYPIPVFPLSSFSLRHVDVWAIRLPWNSPCLSGLTSIAIQASDPSLQQIITILSSSPLLEWFALRDIRPPLVDGGMDLEEHTISLLSLRGLYLQRRNSPWIDNYLLRTIDAPQCRILEATIPFSLIRHPGSTLCKLASIPILLTNCITINYYGEHVDIGISSPFSPGSIFRNGWRGEGDEGHVYVSIERVPFPDSSALESILKVLPLRLDQADVELQLHNSQQAADSARMFGNHPAIWDSATHIHFTSTYSQERRILDLQFLAMPDIQNGQATWPCPRLTQIKFSGPSGTSTKEVAHAVLEFLDRRSAGWVKEKRSLKDEDIVWHTPSPLKVIAAQESFLDVIREANVAGDMQFVVEN